MTQRTNASGRTGGGAAPRRRPPADRRIAERRNNRNIGRVAAARKLVTLVFYGLRDGHIRCLARPA